MDQHTSPQQFKSMAELTAYLGKLENRIAELESENDALESNWRMLTEENDRILEVARLLPKSMIFSNSFFMRALAIWGHNIVIQLIVGLILTICYFTVLAAILPQLLEGVQ